MDMGAQESGATRFYPTLHFFTDASSIDHIDCFDTEEQAKLGLYHNMTCSDCQKEMFEAGITHVSAWFGNHFLGAIVRGGMDMLTISEYLDYLKHLTRLPVF